MRTDREMLVTGHYRWLVCGACFLELFAAIGVSSSVFSVHLPFMKAFDGLSNTECSMILTVRNLCSLLMLLVIDRYLDRLGMRKGIVIGALLVAAGFYIYSIAEGPGVYCVGAVIIGIGFTCSGMLPVSTLLDQWFHTHKALAIGICSAGSGVSMILLPPVITYAAQKVSLERVFLLEAVFIAAVALLFFAVVKDLPAGTGGAADTEKDVYTEKAKDAERGRHRRAYTTVSTPGTILLMFAAGTLSAVAYGAVPNLSLLYAEQGFSLERIAFLITLNGSTITFAKCLFGMIADRAGALKTILLFYSILLGGMALCCFAWTGSYALAGMAMLLLGMGSSLCTVGLSVFALVLSSETDHDYSQKAKWIQTAYSVGTVIVGPAGGIIADRSGSFIWAYMLFIIPAVLSFMAAAAGIRSKAAA